MKLSKKLKHAYQFAVERACAGRLQFLTPELLLVSFFYYSDEFVKLCTSYHVDFWADLRDPIFTIMVSENKVPEDIGDYELQVSSQMNTILDLSADLATSAGRKEVNFPHVLHAILKLEDSHANYLLRTCFTEDEVELLRSIIDVYEGRELPDHPKQKEEDDEEDDYDCMFGMERKAKWTSLVTCVNDVIDKHNPLIGREEELERTIQVLCRRDKNNPLHVGEPGVGKTALVYGLAQRIECGDVPPCLAGARIYMMDMGTIVAGTQYRGEFEERLQNIMKGVAKEKNAIVYIDEIHTLIGSGAGGGGALDGSNILKPYLEAGDIRFIGSTTYKEYNKYFQQAQGIVRRFQMIDIPEPNQEEAVAILEGLKERYEQFHHVRYDDGLMAYAVEMSARYITGRSLPDKAIDLIDEAGAYRQMHPIMRFYKGEPKVQKVQRVGKDIINDTLKRICKLSDESLSATTNGNDRLLTLAERMKEQIYGQDEAIRLLTEAVMMGKAGLLDADKPIASLLFVGPTGVGKTEVCKVLAKELGIELVRFDMSEYTEKHTVAKLIGSPAGYVGYEDGGLLTDAIRKTPNCVLLLDEIEKAHSDIYNILLQVMDYARLTDNRGNKADFRGVILIMTSNAGAQYAAQASIGFAGSVSRGDAMLSAVRKTFKPEFLNRLSGTVVFGEMDRHMAELILEKKLQLLRERLATKQVRMLLTDTATDLLLDKGFSVRNGGREIDRVLTQLLNPLLMREVLFGFLKKGGTAIIDCENGKLTITKACIP